MGGSHNAGPCRGGVGATLVSVPHLGKGSGGRSVGHGAAGGAKQQHGAFVEPGRPGSRWGMRGRCHDGITQVGSCSGPHSANEETLALNRISVA